MLKQFSHLAAFAVVAVLATAPAHATEFLKAIDDVPLLAGLTELPEPIGRRAEGWNGDHGFLYRHPPVAWLEADG